MTDQQILAMPAYRFWSMESQINRIKSECDLREINVHQSVLSQENLEKTYDSLTIQLGETCKVKRNKIVLPEKGAKEKFLALLAEQ